jgi:hypothetical protein
MLVAMSWLTRHADAVDPRAGVASLVGMRAADDQDDEDVTYEAQEA